MAESLTVDPLAVMADAPFFAKLDTAARQTILEASYRRHVRRREFFFFQDAPATTFYFLLEGQARLIQMTPEGHQVIVRYVGTGEGMGIIVALSNMLYPLSAEAVTDCTALAWDAHTILQLMEEEPLLAIGGMQLIAYRFRALQQRYRELATERVERRIARTLLRLARQTGRRTEEGVLLDLPLSRQDLGEMTGTTLYTVSRILSSWEERKLIITGRERVIICDPHGLVTIAEDLPHRKKDESEETNEAP